ncbi:MOSC domain-containing protein, partial [Aureobasidium melanogenum]
MDDQYNKWLSACLGYDVVLAYLGEHERPVLMTTHQKKNQPQTGGWLSSITSKLPTSLGAIISGEAQADDTITFADCAPFLVVNETSLRDVSRRLPDGEEMDISKFRPNIIVSGAESSWEEDYWSELQTSSNVKLHLVQNCVRCVSLNVDYATGKPGEGESGKILKKLQSDRRVDKGAKYSPVFGRYAFLGKGDEGKSLSIGDEVTITQRNTERTTLDWPGIDFKDEDYKDTNGATRNFEPWREAEPAQETGSERLDRFEREGERYTLVGLEAKATNAETEMAVANALDEIMMQNAQREIRVRSNTGRNVQTALEDNDQDKEATRKAFGHDANELVRRLPVEEVDAGEYSKALAWSVPSFQRIKRRKKNYSATLGIKHNIQHRSNTNSKDD